MTDEQTDARGELFWDLAEEHLYTDPAVTRSTMMGYPCLRASGKFFASLERSANHLIVKLPRDRVDALIAARVGLPFAPNGRVFREWVAVPVADEDQWRTLLAEAKAFAND